MLFRFLYSCDFFGENENFSDFQSAKKSRKKKNENATRWPDSAETSSHIELYQPRKSNCENSSGKRKRTFLLFLADVTSLYKEYGICHKAVSYSIHNLVSKIGNFGLKFVHFFGYLILDGVSGSRRRKGGRR